MSGTGVFLSFEGGEGSGKSVQAALLADQLRLEGRDVLLTHEPGGTQLGERIRDILLHAREISPVPRAQALLFNAARAQLVDEVIGPALALGRVVIADRFYDSTIAYQGYGHGVDPAGIAGLNEFAVGDIRPHRTFLLDLAVDVAQGRRATAEGRAWDRFEAGDREFHERLREGYLRLAAAEPARIVVVAGDREQAVIASEIRREVDQLLRLAIS